MRSGSYEYQSEFARKYVAQGREEGREEGRQKGRQEGREKGREEGRQEGEARAVLEVLKARGLEVDAESRQRILACKKPAQLKSWLRTAVTAPSVHVLFESAAPTKARGRRQARKPSRG